MPGASLCRLLRICDIYDDDYRGEDEDDDSVDWNHDGGVCVDPYEGKFVAVKLLTNDLDGAQYYEG